MSRDDRDFEDLLRAAMHERAEQIVPAGDGLQRIRERTSGRHRFRWFKPSLVALTAAAAAAAVAVLPNVIKSADDNNQPVAGPPATSEQRSTEQPQFNTKQSTPPTERGTDRTGDVKAFLWPYANEEIAAKDGTRVGEFLTDAQDTATQFVTSAVAGTKLSAGEPAKKADMVSVPLYRESQLVTTVQLAQVVSGRTTIYLVERAVSPQLSIDSPPNLATLSPPVARGGAQLARPKLSAQAALVTPDAAATRFDFKNIQLTATKNAQPWTVEFNQTEQRHAAMVAWLSDGKGIVAVAAAPTRTE